MTPWDWVVVLATCVWFAWIFTTLIIRFYPELTAAQGLWLWLKRKAAEKVQAMAGRLVVVPVSA